MSPSESPDPKSNVSEASASSSPPAGEAAPSEGAAPERTGGSRISQAPTVCGDEGDLELGEKAAVPASGKVEVAASEDTESPKADPETPADGPEEADQASAEVSEDAPKEEPPEDPLDVAKAEAKRYREQLIRTAADFDNYKKRARREQDEATRRGKEGVLKDLLPIFDNLERAAGHADKTQDVKSLSDGLRMVMKQFEQAVERIGIVRVASVGKPFDPTVHEAIQHLESTEHAAGVVMTEVQSGYQLGNHLIRACMVVVSKGPGPEAAAESTNGEAPADAEGAESGDADEPPASGEQSKD